MGFIKVLLTHKIFLLEKQKKRYSSAPSYLEVSFGVSDDGDLLRYNILLIPLLL